MPHLPPQSAPALSRFRAITGAFGLLFAMLAAAGAGLTLDLIRSRDAVIAERAALADQRSQFLAQWFGTTIVSVDTVLKGLNDMLPPEELTRRTTGPQETARLNSWLRAKADSLPGVSTLSLYGPDCVFRAMSDPAMAAYRNHLPPCTDRRLPLEDRVYLHYVPAGQALSGEPLLLVARHHPGADGTLTGGSVASIPLSYAQDWISTIPVGPNDVLTLTDNDMTILARAPFIAGAIGRQLPPRTDQLQQFGTGRASQTVIATSRIDGRERIFGVSKIEDVPLLIFVGFDLNDALADWRKRCWQLGNAFALLLALAAVAFRAHLTALRQREALRQLAITDPLTGVFNRRSLLATGTALTDRQALPFSLLLVDIDRFKSINDRWGHPTGDRVIQALAADMAAEAGDTGSVARMGGEEFALLLPDTDITHAMTVADRLCQRVRHRTPVLSEDGQPVPFTISIGVTAARPGDSFDSLNSRADAALYTAKETGRDRVASG